MVVGTLAAYAFARLRFPGRGWLILAFMATYMLPPIALILPLYQIMGALGLRDTPLALIIIYSSFVTPFVIWIMRGYIADDPVGPRRRRPRRRLLAGSGRWSGSSCRSPPRACSRPHCSPSSWPGTSSCTR